MNPAIDMCLARVNISAVLVKVNTELPDVESNFPRNHSVVAEVDWTRSPPQCILAQNNFQ